MPKGKPKQAAATVKTAPPAAEKQDAKAPAAKPESANGKPGNKLEGVRWALQKLGNEAKPIQIQDWLKDTYKLKMPVSTITNYKSTLLNKGSKSKAAPKKLGRPAKTAPKAAAPAGGISLDDIRAVKSLADRIGADKVRQLAQVLTK